MANNPSGKYRKRKKKSGSSPIVLVLMLVMAGFMVLALGLRMILGTASTPREPSPAAVEEKNDEPSGFSKLIQGIFGSKETEPPTEPTEPEPEHVVAEARISAIGDILMHKPVIDTGLQADGSYDFDSVFQYLRPYSTESDCAVANLETTLAGNNAGYKYSGYPAFNCPDAIVDALKNAGFDMLLTANNHCYDTSEYGFLRTVRTVREKGLDTLGTRAEAADKKYIVKELNGIRVGMVCFTYEGQPEKPKDGVVYMNKNALSSTCAPLINSFLGSNLDPFYLELRQIMEDMKRDGAEATILFIHWGEEYQTQPNGQQKQMAQQLCDMGFDVIVGGHPHVIQPVELLTSRIDPDRKTVCLYSTGNAVSNQRIAEMNLKTGHTEDALVFSAVFEKYSDGTVYLQDVELIPCWVDMTDITGSKEYHILPLIDSERSQWQSRYSLSDAALENAKKSYDRTTELTSAGMQQARDYLANQKQQREANYLAAVLPLPDAA